jgi:HPt (histidine-containing phosphotransfer) domain-containing protein
MAIHKAEMLQGDGSTGADEVEAPLDLAHLRRFTMGDPKLELEILGLFADQLPITIDALKSASSEKEWTMAAHTLKGSARAVGAWQLASIAETAERLKLLSDTTACGQMISRLEQSAGIARRYIASLGAAT